MPSTINASITSNGLVQTGDASGNLQLQSNGSTGLTLDTNINVTLANNLSVTGNISSVRGTVTSLILGTAQTPAGTSVVFSGIPSWVERITIIMSAVGSNGTSFPLMQLGTGNTATTSGYSTLSAAITSSAQGVSTSTAGFILRTAASAATVLTGQIVFTNITGNTWTGSGIFMDTQDNRQVWSAGTITLAGVLDMVRVTTVNGTDTLDAGTINIMYE